MLIKAAINGGRSKAEHAAVPVSPEEQAAAVVDCLKAGASAIHLHIRFTGGDSGSPLATTHSEKESLFAEDVARTLLAVRTAAPQALIGVSTGAWILPDPAARHQAVSDWKVLPDFASVNFSEAGAVELANLLHSRGVEVEAGLSDAESAEIFMKSGLAASCIRVLLEPQEQELKRALETVNAIENVLNSGSLTLPRLLHGTDATAWPMIDEALARGCDLRIGFEDTLVLSDGTLARNNAELVTETVRRANRGGGLSSQRRTSAGRQ